MKALVRKHGHTPTRPDQDEVFTEAQWPYWVSAPDYGHLTDENWGYALCENVPEGVELTVDDFEVTEHTKTMPSDMEDGEEQTVRYWTARYVGDPNRARE